VDVGGVCFGYEGETRPIFDHHFDRKPANFHCAAAVVLHHAEDIVQWWRNLGEEEQSRAKIVTHEKPDFDALASVSIVEALLGMAAEGEVWRESWPEARQPEAESWYRPELSGMKSQWRWMYAVASLAAHTDQCREYDLPPERRVPALLALEGGGRHWESDEERRTLFRILREGVDAGKDLLKEAVWDGDTEYAAEAQELKRQLEIYQNDVKQCWIGRVAVAIEPRFGERYSGEVTRSALLDAQGKVAARQEMEPQGWQVVDGLWSYHPRCAIFKNLARLDERNSLNQRGFVFTGITQQAKPGQPDDTYFSLNPERLKGGHLYPLWARLQAEEVRARQAAGYAAGTARTGYEARAGASPLFQYPWFDGQGYQSTIVVSPKDGSALEKRGQRGCLAEDRAMGIAREYFAENLRKMVGAKYAEVEVGLGVGTLNEVGGEGTPVAGKGSLRLVQGKLRLEGVIDGGTAELVGQYLWQCLEGGEARSLPDDFVKRHLWFDAGAIGVWSRRGIAIATMAGIEELAEEAGQALEAASRLRAAIEAPPRLGDKGLDEKERKERLDQLEATLQLANVALWKAETSRCRLAQRLFAALSLHQQLQLVQGLYATVDSVRSLATIEKMQVHASHLELFIFAIYAVELGHVIAGESHKYAPGWTTAFVVGTLLLSLGWPRLWKHAGLVVRYGLVFVVVVGLGSVLSSYTHHIAEEKAEAEKVVAAKRQVEMVEVMRGTSAAVEQMAAAQVQARNEVSAKPKVNRKTK